LGIQSQLTLGTLQVTSAPRQFSLCANQDVQHLFKNSEKKRKNKTRTA